MKPAYKISSFADIDQNMKIYLICREIDNLRGTLYRQTMFAEFEHQIYSAAEKDQPMTLDKFKDIYRKLLEKYFGERSRSSMIVCHLSVFAYHIFISAFMFINMPLEYLLLMPWQKGSSEGGKDELNDYLNFLKGGRIQVSYRPP